MSGAMRGWTRASTPSSTSSNPRISTAASSPPSAPANMRRAGAIPGDETLPVLADPQAPPILSRADTVVEKYRHPVTYFKSALGLVLLREEIVGPERFDPAFRRFIAAWAFKHPKPADFFRAMESGAGEDLSYWWRGWD